MFLMHIWSDWKRGREKGWSAVTERRLESNPELLLFLIKDTVFEIRLLPPAPDQKSGEEKKNFHQHTLHNLTHYPPHLPIHLLYPHIHHRHSVNTHTHTLLAHLIQPHLHPPLHFLHLMFSPPSPPLIASLSPAEGNVSLRCFLITGTMQQSAVTQPPYQQHNTQKLTQCHTSARKLVIRLIQLRWIKLLAQCCLTGMYWWLYPTWVFICVSTACRCDCRGMRHLTFGGKL